MSGHGFLLEPDFLKLWTGQTISRIGSAISSLGMPLIAALVLHASPFQMGLLSGAGGLVLLVGLFAGAWADRLRRRPILIGTDLGRFAILLTIPTAAALHHLTMTHLYLVAASTSILTVFFDVSYQAWVPSLVSTENLLDANAKLALTESIAEVTGPALTGLLIQWITAPFAILLDAASFLISALSIWLIRKPEPQPVSHGAPDMRREIAEGLRAVWDDPVLRALARRALTTGLFGGLVGGLYMIFAVRELRLTAVAIGVIISVGGGSSLLGAFLAQRLTRRFGIGRTLIAASFATGASTLVLPFVRGPMPVTIAFLSVLQLFDAAWPIYNINHVSLRQAITPNHQLGRVNSAMHLLFTGMLPIGAFAGGAIAEAIGIRPTMFIGALGFLLSTLWLIFSPLRTLRNLPRG
jgi:predicted MFS family arabinose efflux permease